MNFWQTLIQPDHEEFPERARVVQAANLHDVGEFQFLQLAFADWHGRDMNAPEMAAIFDSFMVRSQVPGWARRYADAILAREQAGALNEGDARYHRFDIRLPTIPPATLKLRFVAVVAFLLVTVFGSIALAHITSDCPGALFPPCIGQQTGKN